MALIALAVAGIWLGVANSHWLDPRPVQRVLILGHSYTYYNDMPAMVAKMADSADSPVRFDITMSAFPNATLQGHWNNRKTRELLSEGGWDRVVAQSEGGGRYQDGDGPIYVYGSKLLIGTGKERPAVIVGHRATDEFYQRHYSTTRSEDGHIERSNVRGLAYATSADVIDVDRVWERVRAEDLPFSLYKDGNHPSLQGSYLIALVVYTGLSHADVTAVSYVPWGMSEADGQLIRQHVQVAIAGT